MEYVRVDEEQEEISEVQLNLTGSGTPSSASKGVRIRESAGVVHLVHGWTQQAQPEKVSVNLR